MEPYPFDHIPVSYDDLPETVKQFAKRHKFSCLYRDGETLYARLPSYSWVIVRPNELSGEATALTEVDGTAVHKIQLRSI